MSGAEDKLVLRRGVAKGKCRSCRREVVFAEHATSGKLAPFEVDPAGVWTIENGVAIHVGTPDDVQEEQQLGLFDAPPAKREAPKVERYTSHFSTCPGAKKWRR